MDDFRLRQVHLDFHTSPCIPEIGKYFDKKEWQETLKLGHIDSITVFSKCHHGYSYHPTKVNKIHPGLNFDLLKAQLDACKEINVKAPVYISAGFDEKEAVAHPEWVMRNQDNYNEPVDFSRPGYHCLCFNTDYLDLLLKEIEEVMELYNPCEVFLDIVGERTCWCAKCRKDMEELGIDYGDFEEVRKFGKKIYRNYLDRVEETVRKYSKDTLIFQNSGHIFKGRRDLIDTMNHLELESLPTGGWGYDHFPMSASYARTQREDFLGMTGKFHCTWGEFGGFKHPNALIYETSLSLAMGAGCSIGDQMHPEGRLNKSTFALIGKAYEQIEKKEKYCKGAKVVSQIGILSVDCLGAGRNDDKTKSDVGANRIMLETGRLYDFIDTETDFSAYEMIILPDWWQISDENIKNKLKNFADNGGKILLAGKSGLDENGKFIFDTGIVFKGENRFRPTYFIPGFETVNGTTEYLMRAKSYLFDNVDAEIVAYGQNPYFNRTAEHFCSHQHAPNDRSLTYPTVAVKNNIAYIGWDVFYGYAMYGDLHQKELVDFVIRKLMNDEFTVEVEKPDRAIVSLMKKENNLILHTLYAHTTKRGENIEVIEDCVPLYDVKVKIKCDRPESVKIVPDEKEIEFDYRDGYVRFKIPKLYIHSMVLISL